MDVSGAVRTPGVYLFVPGDRVEDALSAAEGPTEDADLERLNLAAKLQDTDQAWVPRKGDSPPEGTDGAPRVNIYIASMAELEALPSIGEVRAQRIIDSRRYRD